MKDLTFNVPERTVTALVGSSGSGKTTITNLLLRFWEPQAGCIRIGGVDIREMDYDDLLGKISVVMQNVILFPTPLPTISRWATAMPHRRKSRKPHVGR